MSIPQKSTRNKSLAGYLPAVLKKNKSGWLIEYYVENPFTKDFVRKQIKLSHIINRYELKREGIRVNKNGENESIYVVEKDAKKIYESLGKLLNIPTA